MDTLSQAFLPANRIDLAREPDLTVGPLRIRPSKREVEGGGVRRMLQRRVMQVLVALAQSKSGVASQHELVMRCWGGLSVSDDAIARCIAQLRRLAASWPEPPFAIQTIAGVGYCLAPAGGADASGQMVAPATKPIVAVLPFLNMSDDAEQDHFAGGVVDELVASLSRFRAFHVVSAGGGMLLEGERLTPLDAARQLGARYILEGSIRKADDKLRIVVHLIDGNSAAEIWADRFEGALTDVFALQDRVAEQVAGAIEPMVQEAGVAATYRRATSNLDSYELSLRALALFRLSRKAEMLESTSLLERAIALDPTFAQALGQLAINHRQIVDHGWAEDLEMFRRRGLNYAERALLAAPDDARTVVLAAGGLSGLDPTIDRALTLTDRAIALNPASPFVWLVSGSVQARAGHVELASQYLENAIRLDPISMMGSFARMYLAVCRFQQRRFAEALALFSSTSLRLPVSYAVLAALYGHLGRYDDADLALAAFDAVEAGPIEKFSQLWFPLEESRALFIEGVRLAETVRRGRGSKAID